MVVVLSLYYFEWRENLRLWKKVKEIEGTNEYKLKKRVEYLEHYIALFLKKKKQDTVFVATFEKVGVSLGELHRSSRAHDNGDGFSLAILTSIASFSCSCYTNTV